MAHAGGEQHFEMLRRKYAQESARAQASTSAWASSVLQEKHTTKRFTENPNLEAHKNFLGATVYRRKEGGTEGGTEVDAALPRQLSQQDAKMMDSGMSASFKALDKYKICDHCQGQGTVKVTEGIGFIVDRDCAKCDGEGILTRGGVARIAAGTSAALPMSETKKEEEDEQKDEHPPPQALALKSGGNLHFKAKKYALAVETYTAAIGKCGEAQYIEQLCLAHRPHNDVDESLGNIAVPAREQVANPIFVSSCLSNRALSHLKLSNHAECIGDTTGALEFANTRKLKVKLLYRRGEAHLALAQAQKIVMGNLIEKSDDEGLRAISAIAGLASSAENDFRSLLALEAGNAKARKELSIALELLQQLSSKVKDSQLDEGSALGSGSLSKFESPLRVAQSIAKKRVQL